MGKPSSDNCIRLNASWPEIEILREDDSLLAINKPAGLLIAADRLDKTRENLLSLIHAGIHLQRPWAKSRKLSYLAHVHRLDQGTSGIALFARDKVALTNLARQFHQQKPKHTYVALIQGNLTEPEQEISLPLAQSLVDPGITVVDHHRGKPCVTRVTQLESFRGYSLVKAETTTEIPHQIRVHLREVGCPLVADHDYGTGFPLLLSELKKHYRMKREGEHPLMARPAMHAERIELHHPLTGDPLIIEAAWPKDMTISVKYLRKFASH
ncbi:MAG: RluA family pseudouridine synthase [bacterium]